MPELTPEEQFESTDLLKKREYEIGYKQGWKDGVADLLKKQQEQEKTFASQKDYEESTDPKNKGVKSLSEWAEMHGATQDKETGEWTV